jgi:hypothetical protein
MRKLTSLTFNIQSRIYFNDSMIKLLIHQMSVFNLHLKIFKIEQLSRLLIIFQIQILVNVVFIPIHISWNIMKILQILFLMNYSNVFEDFHQYFPNVRSFD